MLKEKGKIIVDDITWDYKYNRKAFTISQWIELKLMVGDSVRSIITIPKFPYTRKFQTGGHNILIPAESME